MPKRKPPPPDDVVSLPILKFCAWEVWRQQDDGRAVYWMVEAWLWATEQAVDRGRPLTVDAIKHLGQLVQPEKNPGGFREVDVRVGARLCPSWAEVPQLVAELVANQGDYEPDQFYYHFEMIHPFRDGNGRTGKIVLNWLAKSLGAPRMPPNFWGSANP